jgi:hypothetical protein
MAPEPLQDGAGDLSWTASAELVSPRFSPAAAFISPHEILIAGGRRYTETDLRDAFILDVAAGTVSPAPPLPSPRSYRTPALLPDGDLAVIGGKGITNTMEVFQRAERQWSSTAPIPLDRLGFTVCTTPSGLLLIGGTDESDRGLRNVFRLPARDQEWIRCADLPTGRFRTSATLLESGQVLVTGGYLENRELARHIAREVRISRDSHLYDPAADRWTTVESLNLRRAGHQAIRLGSGEVLVAGGYSSEREWSDVCELYDPETKRWAVVQRLPQTRWGFQLCLLPDGDALLIGGRTVNDKNEIVEEYLDQDRVTFRFQTRTRTWARGPSLRQSRSGFGMAVGQDAVLVAGGTSAGPILSTTEYLKWK